MTSLSGDQGAEANAAREGARVGEERAPANKKVLYTVYTPGFAYNSGTNADFLTVEEIRSLIREELDPNFAAPSTPNPALVGESLARD